MELPSDADRQHPNQDPFLSLNSVSLEDINGSFVYLFDYICSNLGDNFVFK